VRHSVLVLQQERYVGFALEERPRDVIRDWAGHGSDKLVDLYTKKMWEYHSSEMSKVKPLLELDSRKERGEWRVGATYCKLVVYTLCSPVAQW
jgi:hypothetical protein